MKRSIIFLISILFYAQFSGEKPLFNAPDLGKTHFIVGLPPQELATPSSAPVVCETDLTGKLRCSDGGFKQAFFSPDDDLQKLLIDLIAQEQISIRIAIFSFTDGTIAHALIDACKRGIDVEIITDISSTRDKFNKIELLKKEGIKIFFYNPRNTTILNNIMHHKFVLFGKNVAGKSLLWTGSFNFTKSATMNNQENVLILDEMHLIEKYEKQFAMLKERTSKKASMKIAHKKRTKKYVIA